MIARPICLLSLALCLPWAQAQDGGPARIRLDAVGQPLTQQAAAWHCVADEGSGLVWEVKSSGQGLRHKDWRYRWSGTASADGACGLTHADCTANSYAAAANDIDNGPGRPRGLCGFSDWRLPLRTELQTVLQRSRAEPAADVTLFPTLEPAAYWTATSFAGDPALAWSIDFRFGIVTAADKSRALRVMLVRGTPKSRGAP